MEDAGKLDLVLKAISSGWRGHIDLHPSAAERIQNDPDLRGLTALEVKALLRKFVADGNQLEVRVETRVEYLEEYPDHPFWYRARIPVDDFSQPLFVEIRLVDDDPKMPWVLIVNAHL